jgi:hypothetical protein
VRERYQIDLAKSLAKSTTPTSSSEGSGTSSRRPVHTKHRVFRYLDDSYFAKSPGYKIWADRLLSKYLEGMMLHEVIEDRNERDTWRVEAIHAEGDGEVFVAIFSGPDAENCAREYASWKNSASRELARAS